MRSAAITAVALAGLASCAVGPEYHRPATPVAAEGSLISTDRAGGATAEAPDAWWTLYGDPALDSLVSRALVANADLRAAEANLSRARAILSEARSGRLPTTGFSGGATYSRSASANASAAAQGRHATADWVYDTGFDVSYQLDLFGRVRRSIESAGANLGAVEAARDAVRITVASEVARAYLDSCGSAEQLAVARRNLALTQSNLELTRLQTNAGRLSELETARAETLVEQASSTIPTLEGQQQADRFAVAALLGLAPREAPPEASACAVTPRLSRPIPVGDGAGLIRRRPDVRQAERTLAANTAQIGVVTADLYPTVTLGGSIGSVADSIGGLASRDAVNFGLGPLIQWTFPNISATRARIREARAGAEASLAEFDGAVLTALREAEQALTLYGAELRRNASLARARDAARTAYSLVQQRYQAGTISQLDIITAEQTFIQAEQALAQSNQALADDQITVFKALGGGWRR